MSFSPLHIWASMGLPSKVIATFLLLMATMSLAVLTMTAPKLFDIGTFVRMVKRHKRPRGGPPNGP